MTRCFDSVFKFVGLALLGGLAPLAWAAQVTVPVQSSNSTAWLRSDGGSGTVMPTGGPAVWNARFVATIPAGATNISFTLDSFQVDDKGVIQLNSSTIADAVIFSGDGVAAGPGTFDFGLGAGNQPYVFAGFTPGNPIGLANGTTSMTLVVYVNDTGTPNPSAPPLSAVFLSSFSLNGTLTYSVADAPAEVAEIPTLSEWGLIILATVLALMAFAQGRRRR